MKSLITAILLACTYHVSAATLNIYNSTSNFDSLAETIWIKAHNLKTNQWEQKGFNDWTWTLLPSDSRAITLDYSNYDEIDVIGYLGTEPLIIKTTSWSGDKQLNITATSSPSHPIVRLCAEQNETGVGCQEH
ncbi:MAG: hypothetical protein ACPGUD_11400 [Parashewanella sp.]